MLWKELHAGPQFRVQNLSTVVVGLVLIMLLFLGFWLLVGLLGALAIGELPEAIVLMIQLTGVGSVSLALLVVGHYAAGRISHEREEGTLDLLLLTPLSRSEILHAKWLGSLYGARQFAWPLGILWLGGTLLAGLNILSLPLLLLAAAIFAAFIAWLGLFCSVVCRTTVRATLWTLGVLAALLVAPLALGIRQLAGFSPIASLAVLTFGYNRIPAAEELEPVLAWLVVYALATFFLWGATTAVFRRR
jgi:ABC-type transport system involved in multi-copper enzyme maturation permease subunit